MHHTKLIVTMDDTADMTASVVRKCSASSDNNFATTSVPRPSAGSSSVRTARTSLLDNPSYDSPEVRDEDHGLIAVTTSLLYWNLKAIHPKDNRYILFWYLIVLTALTNALVEPYKLAFTSSEAFGPDSKLLTAEEIIVTLIFTVDIILKFFVAYPGPDGYEMDLGRIRRRYLRTTFLQELLFTFPFAPVILSCNPDLQGTTAGLYIGLLGLLKLGRLYEIPDFFVHMDYSMILGQVQLMILRNVTYLLLSCHTFACIFYFTARVHGFAPDSWVGAAMDHFDEQPDHVKYMYSLYLAILTSSGVGDAALYAQNPMESLIMSTFCLMNVFVAAYILGTVTMLMVKGDEKSGVFRGLMSRLKSCCKAYRFPEELELGMQQHLEMHYLGDNGASDDKVLGTYPLAIKRKVLRHLYLSMMKQCYLFTNLKPRFLDALLAVSRTDLFLPNVQLVTEGDNVPDLYIIVDGMAELAGVQAEDASAHGSKAGGGGSHSMRHAASADIDTSCRGSSAGGSTQGGQQRPMHADMMTTSYPIGAVAFFSETPSTETIWTVSAVKALIISRAQFEVLQTTHPRQVQKVFSNLKRFHEREFLDAVNLELHAMDRQCQMMQQLKPYMKSMSLATADVPPETMLELKDLLPLSKAPLVEKLELIKGLIDAYFMRKDQQLTIELLDAASVGADETVRRLLGAGTSANKADYDQRTALMVAAQEGRETVLKLLLEAGAKVNDRDIFGTNALVGALKYGHLKAINVLLANKASLADCTSVVRNEVISSILKRDMPMLGRYLDAGTDPNMCDHYKSTLLHVAAMNGDIDAAQLLLEAGADVLLCDRWGDSPLDDATRAGATAMVQLLTPLVEQAKQRLRDKPNPNPDPDLDLDLDLGLGLGLGKGP